jgi:hypothetical protein
MTRLQRLARRRADRGDRVTVTVVGGYRALPESLTAITLMANPMNGLRSRTHARLYVYDAVLKWLAHDFQDMPPELRQFI